MSSLTDEDFQGIFFKIHQARQILIFREHFQGHAQLDKRGFFKEYFQG